MAPFFGMRRIKTIDDWRDVVGKDKWKEGYSACELAHSWLEASGFPAPVERVLASTSAEVLAGLHLRHCTVEMPVFLDNLKAPSWNDIMAYARNGSRDSVVIAVEGKARESFGERIDKWIRETGFPNPEGALSPTRKRRLEYVCQHLRVEFDPDSGLRYQLFHRTFSAVHEASRNQAAAAIMLVHSFDDTVGGNWDDFLGFASWLGLEQAEKNTVLGPVMLGAESDVPTFLVWVSDKRRGEPAN
jgi:hypothetical protein